MSDLIKVGILGKVVGLKGFIKIHNFSDFPEQFKKNASFFLKDGKELIIKEFNNKRFLAIFNGYEDIESAKDLTNKEIYQSIENTRKFCKLKENEFFYFDIIGLEIFEDNKLLGRVVDILDVGISSLLKIQTDKNQKDLNKEFFIPYPHSTILKISLEDKKIYTKDAKFFAL